MPTAAASASAGYHPDDRARAGPAGRRRGQRAALAAGAEDLHDRALCWPGGRTPRSAFPGDNPRSPLAGRVALLGRCSPAAFPPRQRGSVREQPRGAHHPLGEGRGAAHVQDREGEGGRQVRRAAPRRSTGRTGSRARRRGPARTGHPSGPGRLVTASGVRLRETSVAMRSPAASPSAEADPASSTTPVSIPPDPVTGFCIFPAPADDVQHRAAHGSGRAARGLAKLAVGRGVQVQPLHRDPDLVRPDRRGRRPAARPPAAVPRPASAPGAGRGLHRAVAGARRVLDLADAP